MRQMDEFFCIESTLGEVAGVLDLTYVARPFEANAGGVAYHKFEEPAQEEKKEAKPAGDGEEEEPAAEDPPAEAEA